MTTLLWAVISEAFSFISIFITTFLSPFLSVCLIHNTHTKIYALTHGQQPFSMEGQATFEALWNITFTETIQSVLQNKSSTGMSKCGFVPIKFSS